MTKKGIPPELLKYNRKKYMFQGGDIYLIIITSECAEIHDTAKRKVYKQSFSQFERTIKKSILKEINGI